VKWRPDFTALSGWTRRTLWGGVVLLTVLLLAGGGWYWWERQQEAGQTAFDQAFTLYRQAMTEGTAERLAQAVQALDGVVSRYPRHASVPLAHYALGNLHYRARAYEKATASFESAVRTGRGSLTGVSRLGLGYTWEARGDPGRALEVYQQGLQGRDAKDPFFSEFLLAVARTQVALKRPAEAQATYQRFLKDLPTSPRIEDVKAQLARWESAPRP
jgi:TolA-binding protein